MHNLPRRQMKIKTSSIPATSKHTFRNIQIKDAKKLGPLMIESDYGTIDDECYTPEQAENEMQETLTGKYGDFLDFASFLVEDAAGIQSASIVTLYKGTPLLAYIMTRPDSQKKGLASFLIQRSIDVLAQHGYAELELAVTKGNSSAEKLYEKLGFKDVPSAKPKQPPPKGPL